MKIIKKIVIKKINKKLNYHFEIIYIILISI